MTDPKETVTTNTQQNGNNPAFFNPSERFKQLQEARLQHNIEPSLKSLYPTSTELGVSNNTGSLTVGLSGGDISKNIPRTIESFRQSLNDPKTGASIALTFNPKEATLPSSSLLGVEANLERNQETMLLFQIQSLRDNGNSVHFDSSNSQIVVEEKSNIPTFYKNFLPGIKGNVHTIDVQTIANGGDDKTPKIANKQALIEQLSLIIDPQNGKENRGLDIGKFLEVQSSMITRTVQSVDHNTLPHGVSIKLDYVVDDKTGKGKLVAGKFRRNP